MNRNGEERVSRTQRHRMNLEGADQYDSSGRRDARRELDAYEHTSAQTRRRRSQAARLMADDDDDIQRPVPGSSRVSRDPYAAGRQRDASLPQERPKKGGRGVHEERLPERRPGKPPRARDYRDYDEDDDLYDDIEDDVFGDDERPQKRHLLRWIIICVIILALLAGATFIGLRRPDMIESVVQWGREVIYGPTPSPSPSPSPTPSPTPEPAPTPSLSAATVINLVADPAEQPDINQPIMFTATTTLQTDRVRIVADGKILIENSDVNAYIDTPGGRVWNLMVQFPDPYEGNVEAHPGNEAGWNEASGSTIMVSVGSMEPEPTEDPSSGLLQVGDGITPATVIGSIFIKDEASEFYTRSDATVRVSDADDYRGLGGENTLPGVVTFRGSNMRQNAAYGTVTPADMKLTTLWTANAGIPTASTFTYNVQAAIVQWHANIRGFMQLNENKASKENLKEVIFGGTDGRIYFFDLDDGQATREAVTTKYEMPLLGAPAIYPNGVPLLFIGAGDPSGQTQGSELGVLVYDLISASQIGRVSGEKAAAISKDETFITSPLIDIDSDVLTAIGGNGLLYTVKLGKQFSSEGELKLVEPSTVYYLSKAGGENTAVYSNYAMFDEYVYFASLGGILQCVNVNTLKTEWAVNLGGETTAAIGIEADYGGGDASLYIATNMQAGGAMLRRINARTGEMQWSVSISGTVNASPVLGTDNVARFIYITAADDSAIYALDKNDGELLWSVPLSGGMSASPVALYDAQGAAYIVQGDGGGLYLLDGQTGEQLDYLSMADTPIGSPAAFNNTVVVPTSSGKLYGIRIQ